METKKSFKILSALSLASSDAREETLRTVIINTLFEKEGILKTNIEAEIKDSFGFEPYSSELHKILHLMIESNEVVVQDEKLSLMDQLIQKNSEKLTLETTLSNNVMDSSLKEVITKDLISNIFIK